MNLTPKELRNTFNLTKVESEKAELLLLWFNAQTKERGFVDIEEFGKRYKWTSERGPYSIPGAF